MSAVFRLRRAALLAATLLGPARAHAQRIAEVQIAPPYMRMVQDAQAQLVATVYDGDGNPVNARLRWSSSNINVATVATDGTVRAIAPGNVLITAAAESEGRRVVGRATVHVMRAASGVTAVFIGPPGATPAPAAPSPSASPSATPATPPTTAMPGPPPRRPGDLPPGAWVRMDTMGRAFTRMDSLTRANVNCAEPFLNAANPMRACHDRNPELRDSSFVPPERPGKDKCPTGTTNVMLMVQVNEHGRVDGVLPFMSSMACGEYVRALVESARRAVFTPAEKDGQPVRAWVRLHVRGE